VIARDIQRNLRNEPQKTLQNAKRGLRREDDALDAFFEDGDVKVDQKAKRKFGRFKIRHDLGIVNRG
jgi:succinate dehydrogenase flavin-adding protein (antitoxin of CptAB toxin-antitoxin module)